MEIPGFIPEIRKTMEELQGKIGGKSLHGIVLRLNKGREKEREEGEEERSKEGNKNV